jgi:nucleoid-associated protein YgaU
MHSIERYGIVALLFLIVTVVAVLMWDGGKPSALEPIASGQSSRGSAATKAPPAKPLTEAERADARDRRMTLVAEGRPGPLQRQRLEASAPDALTGAEDAEELELDAPPFDARGDARGDASGDASAPRGTRQPAETQTPREQLVRDDFIANAPERIQPDPQPKPAGRTYSVRAGDTLSEIAQRELGSSRRWPEIVAANPGLAPATLRSGTSIRIPGAASAAASESAPRTASAPAKPKPGAEDAPKAGATWKVGTGENLWRIAERALGDGKRWGEIAKLNPRVDPDKLLLGQVLKLPAGSAPAAHPAAGSSAPAAPPKRTASTASTAREASAPVVAQADRPRTGGTVL